MEVRMEEGIELVVAGSSLIIFELVAGPRLCAVWYPYCVFSPFSIVIGAMFLVAGAFAIGMSVLRRRHKRQPD